MITNTEEFCWCRSWKDGERCRFFRGMPPLKPGFVPSDSPWFRKGHEHEEIEVPSGILKLGRAHQVLTLEGADLMTHEVACIGTFRDSNRKRVVYAWFPQSDTFLQGKEALRNVGIKVVDDTHDPSRALDALREAAMRVCAEFPRVKIAMGIDDGAQGLLVEGNVPYLMDALRKAAPEHAEKEGNGADATSC